MMKRQKKDSGFDPLSCDDPYRCSRMLTVRHGSPQAIRIRVRRWRRRFEVTVPVKARTANLAVKSLI